MTDSDSDGPSNGQEAENRGGFRTLLLALLALVLLLGFAAAAFWFWGLFWKVHRTALQDQAAPADAIAVFGAAEYNGRPSPVLTARLQHALDLYRRGLAPVIVTLGGGSGPQDSEGDVGRDFLLAHGVPDDRIIPETTSSDTEQSVARLAAIARENRLNTVLIVSDGTHLFRIQQLCAAQGLHVLLSPRETGRSVNRLELAERYMHEMVGYTLWRLHLH
ncbi:MAG: YdcF family protein [Acidobacteriaceae bacterium]